MTVKLFSLEGVPDDEANEIRELLESNHISFYETPAGNWGISLAAIWLPDDSQLEEALYLINQYQKERSAESRKRYEDEKAGGQIKPLKQKIKERPTEYAFYFFVLVVVIIGLLFFANHRS